LKPPAPVRAALQQTCINYRQSPLSGGTTGDVDGGAQLPLMETSEGENFEPLKSLDWQIQIYGVAGGDLRHSLPSPES
jgi:hypothetical protein